MLRSFKIPVAGISATGYIAVLEKNFWELLRWGGDLLLSKIWILHNALDGFISEFDSDCALWAFRVIEKQKTKNKLPDGFRERSFFTGKIWGKWCRGCDFLLVGWWWGNRASPQESCAQPEVTILYLGGASVPAKELKDIRYVYSLRWNWDPSPRLLYCSLIASPLFLHTFPYLICNCLNLPFGTPQGLGGCIMPISDKQERIFTLESLKGSCLLSRTEGKKWAPLEKFEWVLKGQRVRVKGSDVNILGSFENTESLGIDNYKCRSCSCTKKQGKDKKEQIHLKSWGRLRALRTMNHNIKLRSHLLILSYNRRGFKETEKPLSQIKWKSQSKELYPAVPGRILGAETQGRCFGFSPPGSSSCSPFIGHVRLVKVLKLSRHQCPHLYGRMLYTAAKEILQEVVSDTIYIQAQ